jgi:hypothetical protein
MRFKLISEQVAIAIINNLQQQPISKYEEVKPLINAILSAPSITSKDADEEAPMDNAVEPPMDNAVGIPVDNAVGIPVDNAVDVPMDNAVEPPVVEE